MTNEELVALIQAGQNDRMGELISQNKGLIWAFSRRYTWQNDCAVDLDDIKQAAVIGMIESVQPFDSSAGMSFSTYAMLFMRKSVRELLGIRSSKERFENKGLARIDETISEEGNKTRGDILADQGAVDPQERAELVELQRIVREEVNSLPDILQQIVNGYWLESLTMAQVADRIGIPCSRAINQRFKGEIKLMRSKRLQELIEEYRGVVHRHVGAARFATTWTSSVEQAVDSRERIRARLR